jgi:hypothetical protein
MKMNSKAFTTGYVRNHTTPYKGEEQKEEIIATV